MALRFAARLEVAEDPDKKTAVSTTTFCVAYVPSGKTGGLFEGALNTLIGAGVLLLEDDLLSPATFPSLSSAAKIKRQSS